MRMCQSMHKKYTPNKLCPENIKFLYKFILKNNNNNNKKY